MKELALAVEKGVGEAEAGQPGDRHGVTRSVRSGGLAVGCGRLGSLCVNDKWRLLGLDGAWLFSLLDNLRNRHLEINPKFQQIYRKMSNLLSEMANCCVSLSL